MNEILLYENNDLTMTDDATIIALVRFKKGGKTYAYKTKNKSLHIGDRVVVKRPFRGLKIGVIADARVIYSCDNDFIDNICNRSLERIVAKRDD